MNDERKSSGLPLLPFLIWLLARRSGWFIKAYHYGIFGTL